MKITGKIIKFILILVLTVSIISLIFLNILSNTILQKQYILDKIEETGYYKNIKVIIEDTFQNYVGQSGLDKEVLEDIVTEEKVKEDMNIILSNIYEGTSIEISVIEIEENLRNNIEEYLDVKLTATQQKMVDEYVKTICNEYLSVMSHTGYENTIYKNLVVVNKYTEMAKTTMLISGIISAILIVVFNYKNILRGVSNIGISLVSSGIFTIIVNLYINTKIKIANITILNEAVSEVIRNIMTDILNTINGQGIMILVIGIVLIILGNVINGIISKNREEINE